MEEHSKISPSLTNILQILTIQKEQSQQVSINGVFKGKINFPKTKAEIVKEVEEQNKGSGKSGAAP